MITLVVLLALAVYRLTRFWIKDTLIAGQRVWVMNKTLGRKPNVVREKLHELLGCPFCLSGQLSWIAVVVAMQWTSIPLPVLVWFAVWGAEQMIWRFTEDIIDVRVNVPNVVRHKADKYGE